MIAKSFLNVAELFTVISRSIANVVFATSIANTSVFDEFEMLNVLSPENVTSSPALNVLLMIVGPATVIAPVVELISNLPEFTLMSTSTVMPDALTSNVPVFRVVIEPDDRRVSTRVSVKNSADVPSDRSSVSFAANAASKRACV